MSNGVVAPPARMQGAAPSLVVAVVVAAGTVAALQLGKAAGAAPMLQADLGIGLPAVAWLTAIFSVLGVVGGMPAGALVTVASDRAMLLAGMAALALGAVLGAASSAFAAMLLSRVIEGSGFLLVTVAGPAVLQRTVAGARRETAFALWSCFMPAGIAIAMFSAPQFDGWRTLWWPARALPPWWPQWPGVRCRSPKPRPARRPRRGRSHETCVRRPARTGRCCWLPASRSTASCSLRCSAFCRC